MKPNASPPAGQRTSSAVMESYLSPDVRRAIGVCIGTMASAGMISRKFIPKLETSLLREVASELTKNGSLSLIARMENGRALSGTPVRTRSEPRRTDDIVPVSMSPPGSATARGQDAVGNGDRDDVVTEDWVVCLIDGERKVFLTQYLMTEYGISEEEYKKRFMLPDDFPMVPRVFTYSPLSRVRGERSRRLTGRVRELVEEVGSATRALELVNEAWRDHWIAGRKHAGRRPLWCLEMERLADIEALHDDPGPSSGDTFSFRHTDVPDSQAHDDPSVSEVPFCFRQIEISPPGGGKAFFVDMGDVVTEDWVVCLIDGERRMFMSHYIKNRYDLSDAEYRDRFGLPSDFPMVPRMFIRDDGPLQQSRSNKVTARLGEIVAELGSAKLAFELAGREWSQRWLTGRSRRGRRPVWLNKLEKIADKEAGLVAAKADPMEYRFSHIPREPVIPVSEAVRSNCVVCLIDGVKKVFLGRYLMSIYGMTPEDYRIHFGLPDDFPMTATEYREKKRQQAHGQRQGKNVRFDR